LKVEGTPFAIGQNLATTDAMPRRAAYHAKRVFDLVVASLLVILLSPVFLVITAGVKLSSPGPIFYRQWRLRQGRSQFVLLKFRTMVDGADGMLDEVFHLNHANKFLFKAEHDPRITPFGRLLRSTFLDELPQLINVLRGEMSLVGPRPCLPEEAAPVRDLVDFRFAVPQGLTGPWQINGHHALTFEEQLQIERQYIETWSLTKDVEIIVKTIPRVLRRTGL
jgi:lipopolysaccharide/colanic/teichoic acid biosynthesis glycosyltransferase